MSSSTVCVDASFVVRLFMGPDDSRAWERWDAWMAGGVAICAPDILGYELANAFYRYHRAGFVSLPSVEVALDAAFSLPVRLEGGLLLHLRALRLAAEFGLKAAYDAHYLALAQHYQAELWTADSRLVGQVAARCPWVRLLGPTDNQGH